MITCLENYYIYHHLLKWLVHVNIMFVIMDKTTSIIRVVQNLHENHFPGTRELYFMSLSVVGSLPNKITVRKLTNIWDFSFMLEMKVNKPHELLST